MTSVADRTSPVLRGKWVIEVLLGMPPPPPPPNVPDLEETQGSARGQLLSVRERMEEHRANPQCQLVPSRDRSAGAGAGELRRRPDVAHQRQRHADRPSGELYDGTPLTARPACARRCSSGRTWCCGRFTENLMTYGLGPPHRGATTCRRCARSCATRREQTIVSRHSSSVIMKSPAFRMRRADAATTDTCTSDRSRHHREQT